MSTITAPTKDVPSKSRNLVEMNWDPITRIVGSLGIFTKIDFDAARWRSATARRPSFADTAFS